MHVMPNVNQSSAALETICAETYERRHGGSLSPRSRDRLDCELALGDSSDAQLFAVNLSNHELEIPGQQSIPLDHRPSVAGDLGRVSQSESSQNSVSCA